MDSKPDTENCGLLADEPREENTDTNRAIRIPLVPNPAPTPCRITCGKKWMVGLCGVLLLCGSIGVAIIMTVKLIGLEDKLQEIVKEVSFLKEPPHTFVCGAYANTMSPKVGQTITYKTLLYSSTNVAGAELDISSGIFTSGHPGTYTATWSLRADLGFQGKALVDIYLRKNGEQIPESDHYSWYTGTGVAYDQGGRTLFIHLDQGETVDLYCANCQAYISDTSFCVSLSQYDVE